MKVKTIIINNYRDFRLVFESDAEALSVMEILRKAIEEDLKRDETAHLKLQYWVHYNKECLVGFEIKLARFAHGKAFIHADYISTTD